MRDPLSLIDLRRKGWWGYAKRQELVTLESILRALGCQQDLTNTVLDDPHHLIRRELGPTDRHRATRS